MTPGGALRAIWRVLEGNMAGTCWRRKMALELVCLAGGGTGIAGRALSF